MSFNNVTGDNGAIHVTSFCNIIYNIIILLFKDQKPILSAKARLSQSNLFITLNNLYHPPESKE